MNDLELQAGREGLVWENNPVLIQLLGLSPVLAVSNTLAYGVGLGVATFFVCVFSCLTASLLKGAIPHKWRLVWYMLILAGYTTIAETVSQLYFYPLFKTWHLSSFDLLQRGNLSSHGDSRRTITLARGHTGCSENRLRISNRSHPTRFLQRITG